MKRITILTGHYGSGKSEVAINLALRQVNGERSLALVDLDVVNPYFRSREQRSLLEEHGIRVIANALGQDVGMDIPAISAEINAPLQNKGTQAIIDSGGDPAGARLLGRFRNMLPREETDVFCVVNASRPETSNAEGIKEYLHGIEESSGLEITGIVNNTHMLEHTEISHIRKGNEICKEVSTELDIPIRYVGVFRPLVGEVTDEIVGEILPISMYLRETWMSR
ncbi:MAG: ATP-binding protein [Spirochaetia bacterium]